MITKRFSQGFFACALVASVLGGCTADSVGPETAEVTKDEARAQAGKSDHGFDFCDLFGWYGDGECDEFCLEPDPDCSVADECRSDRDCPQIFCVRAPCPSNVCVAGECVIDNPEDDCPAGQRECSTCRDESVCVPHGGSCPLFECPPRVCGNGYVDPGEECDGGPDCDADCQLIETVCGGFLGAACDEGEYCRYPEGANCGRADATGVCSPIGGPICPAVAAPVCGCNGVTYGNSCQAASAGMSVDHNGRCEAAVDPCSTIRCGYGTRCAVCDDGPGCYLPGEECIFDEPDPCDSIRCGYGTRCAVCDDGPGCYLPGEECIFDDPGPASCAAVTCAFGTRCEICDGAAGCYLPGEGCE